MQASECFDGLIRATTKGHEPCLIWSSIDEKQCNQLVEWRLNRAKRSAKEAENLIALIEVLDQITIGMILGPRFLQTIEFYRSSGGISLK